MSLFKTLFVATALALSSLAFAADAVVDVNTADAKTLQLLDGVGPAKAQAIIEYRQANGPFKTADELARVQGIGEKTLEANRERISVGGAVANPSKQKATAKN
jgi:competence protein ComEA